MSQFCLRSRYDSIQKRLRFTMKVRYSYSHAHIQLSSLEHGHNSRNKKSICCTFSFVSFCICLFILFNFTASKQPVAVVFFMDESCFSIGPIWMKDPQIKQGLAHIKFDVTFVNKKPICCLFFIFIDILVNSLLP